MRDMHPEISKLLALQSRDLDLLGIDARLLDLHEATAALDAGLGRARENLAFAIRAIEAEKTRREELEAKMESHRQHQERRREKLQFMKTPKEVAALMAEIDLARSVLGNEENDWVHASDQVTALEARRGEAEGQVAAVEATQAEERAALDQRRRLLAAERRAALLSREADAALIAKPLLQRYDKLRNSTTRRSVVIVALNGLACGACFTTVPLSRRTLIKAGDVIEGCESCGVILYFAE